MAEDLVPCPCGCGARFIPMVAEREAGVRRDAAVAPARPRLTARAEPGVYLLSGMPGAGKSTVGRQLAERFDRAAHVDIDMVFHHFTVSGRAEPSHQTEETEAQSLLAVRNGAAMARNYADAGFVCVLEGCVTGRREVRLVADAIQPHRLFVFVLAPPLDVSEERDAELSGKNVAEHFRHLHPALHRELAGIGLWIDSTDQTPAATVDAILGHREGAKLPPDVLA